MPDHAKKLGELTKRLNTSRETCEDIENVMDILDALGPVVEAMGSGLAEYRAFHEIAGPESHLIEIAVDDIEALLAAVEKLR